MSRAPKNTLAGRSGKTAASGLMTPIVIISLVVISLFAFAALIVLSGYADNWRDKDNGRAHAFSKSGIGFSALSQLLAKEGHDIIFDRTEGEEDEPYALKLITLDRPLSKPLSDDFDLSAPTLIVMPKWVTSPMLEKKGWRRIVASPLGPTYETVNYSKALPESAGDVTFETRLENRTAYKMTKEEVWLPAISQARIANLQTMKGGNLDPLFLADGHIILAKITDEPIYILSDPDFLNTQGLASEDRARFAIDLLKEIAEWESTEGNIFIFDLIKHGFGNSDNLIKYLLRPPFLAATLCLIAAGILIGWQAFARFGDPEKIIPDYALGKSTLANNAARFIKIAGRETKMAPGYVDLIRRRAAKDMNLQGHTEDDINRILARRGETKDLSKTWQDVTSATRNAPDNLSLLEAARTLHNWKQEISNEHR